MHQPTRQSPLRKFASTLPVPLSGPAASTALADLERHVSSLHTLRPSDTSTTATPLGDQPRSNRPSSSLVAATSETDGASRAPSAEPCPTASVSDGCSESPSSSEVSEVSCERTNSITLSELRAALVGVQGSTTLDLEEEWRQIDVDLPRSKIFDEVPHPKLEEVLKAYAFHRSRTGEGAPYTQGMSFVANLAFTLAGTASDEPADEAFLMYQTMVNRVLGPEFYSAHHEVLENGAYLGTIEVPLLDCYAAIDGLRRLTELHFGLDSPDSQLSRSLGQSAMADIRSGFVMLAFRWLPSGLALDLPKDLVCNAWRWALEVADTRKRGGAQVIPLLLVALEYLILCVRDPLEPGLEFYERVRYSAAQDAHQVLDRAKRRFETAVPGGWAKLWREWAAPVWEYHTGLCVAAFQVLRLQRATRFSRSDILKILRAFAGRSASQSFAMRFSDPIDGDAFAAVCSRLGIDEATISDLWHGVGQSRACASSNVSAVSLGDVIVGLSRLLRGSLAERLRFCFDAFTSYDGKIDNAHLENLHVALQNAAKSTCASAPDLRVSLPGRVISRLLSEPRGRVERRKTFSGAMGVTQMQYFAMHDVDVGLHVSTFINRLREVCGRTGAIDFEAWRAVVLADLHICGILTLALGGDRAAHFCDPAFSLCATSLTRTEAAETMVSSPPPARAVGVAIPCSRCCVDRGVRCVLQ